GTAQLSPLTYPVKPSGEVLYPPPDDVRRLLTGEEDNSAKLKIGSLIARGDVEVSLSARHIVSRHLAILAMTGGGKTVAARRIIRELIDLKYPLVIFDPHGDYLGFFEKRVLFPDTNIRIFYPAGPDGVRSTFAIPYDIGLVAGAPHPAAAKKLIDFLLSKAAQEQVSSIAYGYPVRDDVHPTDAKYQAFQAALHGVTIWNPDWNAVLASLKSDIATWHKVTGN
ncbi:MAG: extracellular solute-binding protein, partial [Rhodospirillales bacterium]|nr:extracellular solute-binding protein [Rhodospirillales bacterium]